MKRNEAQEIIQEVKEYVKSIGFATIYTLLKQNFISKYLPQNIEYDHTKNGIEKIEEFMKVIENYEEYRVALACVSNVITPEFLPILIDYDIIKNNTEKGKINNKEEKIQELIKTTSLGWVPELENHSKFYFDSVEKLVNKNENLATILNENLRKKFVYNLYGNIVKNAKSRESEDSEWLKDFGWLEDLKKIETMEEMQQIYAEMSKKHNILLDVDAYEIFTEIFTDLYKKENSYYTIEENLLDLEECANVYYERFNFPENFRKLGYTPENVIFPIALNSAFREKDFLLYFCKYSDLYGANVKRIKGYDKEEFYEKLYENLDESVSNLMEKGTETEIKDFINIYSKLKFTGKLDYTYRRKIEQKQDRLNPNNIYLEESYEENPVITNIEEKIIDKIIEFSEKDNYKTFEFIKTIPEFVCGKNKFSTNFKMRKQVLPKVLRMELNNEDEVDIESLETYDEIMRFLFNKKRKILSNENKHELDEEKSQEK